MIFVLGTIISQAQYLGGNGDGSSSFLLESLNGIHNGGSYDGYSVVIAFNMNSVQRGGAEDGFSMSQSLNANSIQRGSTHDGYSIHTFQNNNSIHRGNTMDGYAKGIEFQRYIWTGTVSQDWTTIDNWTTVAIPRSRHSVIIPRGTPFHPYLQNAGILLIGKDTGSGTYLGRELYISDDAILEIGRDVFIENHGLINNRGTFRIYNISPLSFSNNKNATLNLLEGELIIQNNN